jgi:hypothetical protein
MTTMTTMTTTAAVTTVSVAAKAYMRIVGHALRHERACVLGVLLGRRVPGDSPSVLRVEDAVPLTHAGAPLSPTLDAALEALDAASSSSGAAGVGLVGAWWGGETLAVPPAWSPAACAVSRVAERIAANSPPQARHPPIVLTVDNVAISARPHVVCLHAWALAASAAGWRKDAVRVAVEGAADGSTVTSLVESTLPAAIASAVDWEDVLEDPTLHSKWWSSLLLLP